MAGWYGGGAVVLLLAGFCLISSWAATAQQQLSASFNTTPDELLGLIRQVVRKELRPITRGLEARLDELESKLQSQVDATDYEKSRLDQAVKRTAIQQNELDEVTLRLDRVEKFLKPSDCSELLPVLTSGVYSLWPEFSQTPVQVFCQKDTDGGKMWTVFQRRSDIQPRQDFFLGWDDYKEGFGDLAGEFWLGLEYLARLTANQNRSVELRIDLEDFDGVKTYAIYQDLRISSEEEGYKLLKLSQYTGNASDSLGYNVNEKFSTRDRDNDSHRGSCAQSFQGAWWYPGGCGESSLNGRYLEDGAEDFTGIYWAMWRDGYRSLKKSEMKVRPI